MEQVFDFREFMFTLLKKCKLILILAVVFAILGAGFGYLKSGGEEYMTTAGASVGLAKVTLESAPLTDTMKNVDAIISDNFFYTGMVNHIKKSMGNEKFDALLSHVKNPKLSDMKKIVKVYTKGNLILIDSTCEEPELTQDASRAGMEYILERLPKLNEYVNLTKQSEQTVDLRIQEGSSRTSEILKFGILGFGGGIVLGILWIFFVAVFDLRVKSAVDLKKYSLPVLGELNKKEEKK